MPRFTACKLALFLPLLTSNLVNQSQATRVFQKILEPGLGTSSVALYDDVMTKEISDQVSLDNLILDPPEDCPEWYKDASSIQRLNYEKKAKKQLKDATERFGEPHLPFTLKFVESGSEDPHKILVADFTGRLYVELDVKQNKVRVTASRTGIRNFAISGDVRKHRRLQEVSNDVQVADDTPPAELESLIRGTKRKQAPSIVESLKEDMVKPANNSARSEGRAESERKKRHRRTERV